MENLNLDAAMNNIDPTHFAASFLKDMKSVKPMDHTIIPCVTKPWNYLADIQSDAMVKYKTFTMIPVPYTTIRI